MRQACDGNDGEVPFGADPIWQPLTWDDGVVVVVRTREPTSCAGAFGVLIADGVCLEAVLPGTPGMPSSRYEDPFTDPS